MGILDTVRAKGEVNAPGILLIAPVARAGYSSVIVAIFIEILVGVSGMNSGFVASRNLQYSLGLLFWILMKLCFILDYTCEKRSTLNNWGIAVLKISDWHPEAIGC